MHAVASRRRLTRIVTGDGNVEVAQLQSVLLRIQAALHEIPPSQRDYIANALLNQAARRIAEGERARKEE
jgi:hypothetical protein